MVTALVDFATTDPNGFMKALSTTGDLFDDVEGFHGFKVQRGVEDPNRFLITAEWDSVEAHVAWQKANVEAFLGTLNPHLASQPTITHFA